jgi:rubrerythrin
MSHWSLNDIPWHEFDASLARPDLVSLVKAAAMVEYNGYDYARYLYEVFADDEEFKEATKTWAEEEVQHGMALRKWAELADPSFDFDKSFKAFTDGYKLPVNVQASVRGSRTGELIARCVVETGTSSYYTALKDGCDEPVLKAVCAHIAADEFRHYKLFYTHLKRYLAKENIGALGRLKVALGRITESEDDELTYAFFAAHYPGGERTYERKHYCNLYLSCAYALYRSAHVERMIAMTFKAIGLKPNGILGKLAHQLAWNIIRIRTYLLGDYKKQVMAGV